ncbi:glycosyltransferase, partial [Arthrospira platensis SPKY2]
MIRRGPILHLKTSYAIYRLNHEPLPEEQIFDDVPFVFRKPWIEYKIQMEFSDRFFQFAGMNQARTFEEEEIGTLFEAFIPDYVDVIAKHKDGGKKALHGVFRQYSINKLEQPFQSYFTNATITKVFKQAGRMVGNQPYRHFAEVAWQPFPPIEPQKQKEIDVVFMPHCKYHVWTMYCVTPYLDAQGIKYIFVDSTVPYRDQGVRQGIEERNLPSVSYNNFVLGSFEPKVIVCMNDWDTVVKPVIEAARGAGIPTVGLVEGMQDFGDVDTGRVRKPYRTVEYLFLPGKFDQKYFADCIEKTRVVGIPRIDELLSEVPKFPEKPLVVVNVNFTYNVLEECREEWLQGVVDACKIVGVDYVISQHPADKADLSKYNVSDKSMYDLIRQGSVFVSRFSSGILEALAMGKPVIYHNPHGEKVDQFVEPMGAYPVTKNINTLTSYIKKIVFSSTDRKQFKEFLEFHCDCDNGNDKTSSQKVAESILEIIHNSNGNSLIAKK